MSQTDCQSAVVRSIVNAVYAFRGSRSSLPTTGEHATAKLLAKSLTSEDIERRRAAFTTNGDIDPTAILANYELLQGIKYLDRLKGHSEFQLDARVVTSLFRGAEICLLNLATLCRRATKDASLEMWGNAAIKVTWINYFTETLCRLSQLAVRVDCGETEGDSLSIEDSPAFAEYREALATFHQTLQLQAPNTTNDLSERDLDDPRRFVFFHSYVNTNYDSIWQSTFSSVRLPSVARSSAEDAGSFFERIVQGSVLRDAATCLDLRDETYLMQFRAYHQISEILVNLVNDLGCSVILTLVDESQNNLVPAANALTACNLLLQVVTDNIKPIVRSLSPKGYLAIRPALGVTSGSHSHNLRKGLFLTVYPLLVKAFRLRINAFDEVAARDDALTFQRAQRLLRLEDKDGYGACLRNLVYVYHSVRTWRDEHIQFIKTQIGVGDETPTASISGSENAAATAQAFRNEHAGDLIGPLYEALLGRRPATPLPLVHAGQFDEYMARVTATAVQSMYADVQERVHRRHGSKPSSES